MMMMIDKNKNGVRAYHSQTNVKNCSLSHHKVVDAGNKFLRQFIDDSGLDTVGFVQLKRFSDFQCWFSLSLSQGSRY